MCLYLRSWFPAFPRIPFHSPSGRGVTIFCSDVSASSVGDFSLCYCFLILKDLNQNLLSTVYVLIIVRQTKTDRDSTAEVGLAETNSTSEHPTPQIQNSEMMHSVMTDQRPAGREEFNTCDNRGGWGGGGFPSHEAASPTTVSEKKHLSSFFWVDKQHAWSQKHHMMCESAVKINIWDYRSQCSFFSDCDTSKHQF